MLAAHNTPFGDIVDTEDDLQPLVSAMFKDATRAVSLVAAAMTDATFNVELLAARAAQGWITITELADTLARDHGLPFKAGHTIASRLIAGLRANPDTPMAATLREVSKAVTGTEIVYSDTQLAQILSPQHFVEVRKTFGGPSPSETKRALGVSVKMLGRDVEWLERTRAKLAGAQQRLKEASLRL
jgi:argininosuccinate lyase